MTWISDFVGVPLPWRSKARQIARKIVLRFTKPLVRLHVEHMGPAELTQHNRCHWCKEPLGNTAHPMMTRFHIECAVRMTSGSLAHIEQRCSCYVSGATDNDPEHLTTRQAAMEVYKRVRAKMYGPPS